jgi:hypothetical protein
MLTISVKNKAIIKDPEMMLGLHRVIDLLTTYDYNYSVALYIFNVALSSNGKDSNGSKLLDLVFKSRRLTRSEAHHALVEASILDFGYQSYVPGCDNTGGEIALTRIEAMILKDTGKHDWEWVHASTT